VYGTVALAGLCGCVSCGSLLFVSVSALHLSAPMLLDFFPVFLCNSLCSYSFCNALYIVHCFVLCGHPLICLRLVGLFVRRSL
jgi:hypothetical protein